MHSYICRYFMAIRIIFYLFIYLDPMVSYWLGVNIRNLLPLQFMKLGFLVISVFAASFGPFIALVNIFKLDRFSVAESI